MSLLCLTIMANGRWSWMAIIAIITLRKSPKHKFKVFLIALKLPRLVSTQPDWTLTKNIHAPKIFLRCTQLKFRKSGLIQGYRIKGLENIWKQFLSKKTSKWSTNSRLWFANVTQFLYPFVRPWVVKFVWNPFITNYLFANYILSKWEKNWLKKVQTILTPPHKKKKQPNKFQIYKVSKKKLWFLM